MGDYGKTATIYPFYPEYICNITVNKIREGGKWLPATINWPACGSQNIEYTTHFVKALNLAIFTAKNLDNGGDMSGAPELVN